MRICNKISFLFFLSLFFFACNNQQKSLNLNSDKSKQDSLKALLLIEKGDSILDVDPDSSVAYYKKAIRILEPFPNLFFKATIKLSGAYLVLNDSLHNFYSKEALRLAENSRDSIKIAKAEINLAKSFFLQGKYQESLMLTKHAKRIFQRNKMHEQISSCLNHESTIYVTIGKLSDAVVPATEAIKVDQDNQLYSSMSRDYARLGWVYLKLSDFSKMKDNLLRALDCLKHNNSYEIEAWLYSLLATNYVYLNENNKALEFFDKALGIAAKLKHKEQLISAKIGISDIYVQDGKYDLAMQEILDAIKIAQAKKMPEQLIIGYANLGVLYYYMNNLSDCLTAFNKSLELSIKHGYNWWFCNNCANIAEVYFLMKDYQKCIDFANKSLDDDFGTQRQAYEFLYLAYDSLGNKDQALRYYKLYSAAKDSILNSEKIKQINSLEVQYQTEQKQKQIELQQTQLENKDLQLKKQRTALYSSVAILALFLGVIGLVVLNVKKKKEQQKLLSIKNAELHQQNEEILAQRDEIESQKEIIELKSKEVNDSITYARFIQQSILPSEKEVGHYFDNFFILYSPKDLVSGDFFWAQQVGSVSYCAISDCTGHGVPGGFMSMLGIALLNEIHAMSPLLPPAERLTLLKGMLIKTLKQDSDESALKDGMDISFLSIDYQNLTLSYASALGKVVLVRDNTPTLLEYDRIPVGFSYSKSFEFRNHTVTLQRGDLIYAFTDGIIDQLGGVDKKKYSTKRFTEKLSDLSKLEFSQHKETIVSEFNEWKGNLEQLDDILVFGIKV